MPESAILCPSDTTFMLFSNYPGFCHLCKIDIKKNKRGNIAAKETLSEGDFAKVDPVSRHWLTDLLFKSKYLDICHSIYIYIYSHAFILVTWLNCVFASRKPYGFWTGWLWRKWEGMQKWIHTQRGWLHHPFGHMKSITDVTRWQDDWNVVKGQLVRFEHILSLHFRTKTKLKWKPLCFGDHGHHVSFLLYKWYDLTMFQDTIPSYHLTMYYTHIPLNSNRFDMGVLVHSLKKGLPRPTSKQMLHVRILPADLNWPLRMTSACTSKELLELDQGAAQVDTSIQIDVSAVTSPEGHTKWCVSIGRILQKLVSPTQIFYLQELVLCWSTQMLCVEP